MINVTRHSFLFLTTLITAMPLKAGQVLNLEDRDAVLEKAEEYNNVCQVMVYDQAPAADRPLPRLICWGSASFIPGNTLALPSHLQRRFFTSAAHNFEYLFKPNLPLSNFSLNNYRLELDHPHAPNQPLLRKSYGITHLFYLKAFSEEPEKTMRDKNDIVFGFVDQDIPGEITLPAIAPHPASLPTPIVGQHLTPVGYGIDYDAFNKTITCDYRRRAGTLIASAYQEESNFITSVLRPYQEEDSLLISNLKTKKPVVVGLSQLKIDEKEAYIQKLIGLSNPEGNLQEFIKDLQKEAEDRSLSAQQTHIKISEFKGHALRTPLMYIRKPALPMLVTPGDSGGPVFIRNEQGENQIVAVTIIRSLDLHNSSSYREAISRIYQEIDPNSKKSITKKMEKSDEKQPFFSLFSSSLTSIKQWCRTLQNSFFSQSTFEVEEDLPTPPSEKKEDSAPQKNVLFGRYITIQPFIEKFSKFLQEKRDIENKAGLHSFD